MRERLENALWKFAGVFNEKFIRTEKGDSNMVAVIVLIVIILAVAVIFQEQLLGAVNAVFGNLMDFINQ